jgi:hypothetical protein
VPTWVFYFALATPAMICRGGMNSNFDVCVKVRDWRGGLSQRGWLCIYGLYSDMGDCGGLGG